MRWVSWDRFHGIGLMGMGFNKEWLRKNTSIFAIFACIEVQTASPGSNTFFDPAAFKV